MGGYNSKLKALYTAFFQSIKLSGYKMGIKFDKDSLAVEQNSYQTKIVNICIVYDLAWPNIPLRRFTLQNCLFGATNIVKNSDKEKYVYSGYGIAFHGKGQKVRYEGDTDYRKEWKLWCTRKKFSISFS